jgi:hypothetical protein
MFCAPGHVFGGTEGDGSRFHVLRALTHFRRKRGCRVPFSCFALPESFPTVLRASGPVFKFCTLGLIFGGTVVLMFCAPKSFSEVPRASALFSCFVLPDSISAVPRA